MENKTNYSSKIRDTKPKTAEPETKTEEKPKFKAYDAVITNCANLNFRKEAKADAEVIEVIPAGTKITVIGEKDGWVKYEFNGKKGFSMKQFIK